MEQPKTFGRQREKLFLWGMSQIHINCLIKVAVTRFKKKSRTKLTGIFSALNDIGFGFKMILMDLINFISTFN